MDALAFSSNKTILHPPRSLDIARAFGTCVWSMIGVTVSDCVRLLRVCMCVWARVRVCHGMACRLHITQTQSDIYNRTLTHTIGHTTVHTAELTSARQFEEEDDDDEDDDEEEAVLWTKQQPSQPQQSHQQNQLQAYTTVSSAGSVASNGSSTAPAAAATITPVVGCGQVSACVGRCVFLDGSHGPMSVADREGRTEGVSLAGH